MPVKTKDQLKAELNTTFFQNPGGGITPALVQTFMIDVIDSIPNATGPNYAFGTGAATGIGSASASALALFRAVGTAAGSGSATGIVSSLSPQVSQFFDRLVTMPSASRQGLYATLIDGLVSAGVWSKLDCLYVYAAANPSTALVNLTSSSIAGSIVTNSGEPTFTADSGFSNCGAGSVRIVDTGLSPTATGINYTRNDASVFAWQIGTTAEDRALINTLDNGTAIVLISRHPADGKAYWGINTDGSAYNVSSGTFDGSGLWLMQRTGASASEVHRNDSLVHTSTMASAALAATNLCPDPLADTVAICGAGASLTAPQQTALYSGLSTYLTSIGAI